MYLLDTNICIYLMKNRYPGLSERLLSLDPSETAISSITLFELEYGAAKSRWGERTRENLYAFLSPFTIIPFDDRDAVTAGNIRALLASKGSLIGPFDLLIAAQAYARALIVVTHNTAEFSRIPGLKTEDWVLLS